MDGDAGFQDVRTRQGYTYLLRVVQQPVRCRMCGFGAADRRSITPPPCLQLTVTDPDGREVDLDELSTSSFVLSANLWSEDASSELNMIRNSETSHSISAATSAPFSQSVHKQGFPGSFHSQPDGEGSQHGLFMADGYAGSYSGNLIGSRHVTAFNLRNEFGVQGIWFVLHDLSVRTEGKYRLRCDFFSLVSDGRHLNTERADILCTVFTQPFTVFSAKKFPGMVESTPLSKTFASQGIRIPVRKDGPKSLSNKPEDEDMED